MADSIEPIIQPTDEEFLQTLPIMQQAIVKKYAQDNNLTLQAAFDEMMKEEGKENISDRKR